MITSRLIKSVKLNNSNRFNFKLAVLLLGVAAVLVFSAGAEGIGTVESASGLKMWASGNEFGVYLVVAKEKEGAEGFGIFHRRKAGSYFFPGQWYKGRVAGLTAAQDRLVIFLEGGGCQSYDLTSNRTALGLPEGLQIVGCSFEDGEFYVLAAARQEMVLMLPKAEAATDALEEEGREAEVITDGEEGTGNENSDKVVSGDTGERSVEGVLSEERQWSVGAGDFVILMHGRDDQWRMVSQAAPITDWEETKTKIGLLDKVVYLFGIKNGVVQHCRLQNGEYTEAVSVCKADALLAVLRVNRKIRLVVGEEQKAGVTAAAGTGEGMVFRVGQERDTTWVFSELVRWKKDFDGPWVCQGDKACFAVMGENLACFEWRSGREVIFGQYSSSGELLEDIDQAIGAVGQEPVRLLEWFFGSRITTVLMLSVMMLVFWRREEAFGESKSLPGYVELAPVWRRVTAFALDVIVVLFVTNVVISLMGITVSPELFRAAGSFDALQEQMSRGYLDPQMVKTAMIVLLINILVFIFYSIFCELYFSATPGKRVLGLLVVSAEGGRVSASQVLVRNLLRVLDFYPHPQFYVMTLIIIVITARRQRCGDLMARTMVVMKTPELSNRSADE